MASSGYWPLSHKCHCCSDVGPLACVLLACYVSVQLFHLTHTTQSLEKEVQEVKATLQTMFAQLKEEEQELKDNDLMKSGTEEEEEDEDQYFSDSWDI